MQFLRLFKGLIWVGTACALLIGSSPTVSLAQVVSLRVLGNGGVEAEGHIGSVGVFYSFAPGFHTAEVVDFSGNTICKEEFDRSFLGARYFFDGVQDGWYAGAAAYSESRTTDGTCFPEENEESGGLPMLGYMWLWDSGFNVDLGLRPGIIALGITF